MGCHFYNNMRHLVTNQDELFEWNHYISTVFQCPSFAFVSNCGRKKEFANVFSVCELSYSSVLTLTRSTLSFSPLFIDNSNFQKQFSFYCYSHLTVSTKLKWVHARSFFSSHHIFKFHVLFICTANFYASRKSRNLKIYYIERLSQIFRLQLLLFCIFKWNEFFAEIQSLSK